MRNWFRVSCTVLFIAALIWGIGFLGIHKARADDAPQLGQGLVCDSQEQIEAFVALNKDDSPTALEAVNAKYGKDSCGILTVAYLKGDEVSTVKAPGGLVHVTRIRIVGIYDGHSWMRLAEPYGQFTPFFEKAQET